ncbi:hypothetical protein AB0948_04360 [Streptomyces koyangensis]|uniref:hypothetical protein n=1 Tax=Streptomyces koyangensis TaxID=188770 RepID=UPI0034531CFA
MGAAPSSGFGRYHTRGVTDGKNAGRPREPLRHCYLQKVDRGEAPADLGDPFPVGGHRFRPNLEDVLLLLEREFAIDVEPGWRKIVDAETQKWRLLQLRAAVRDAPDVAAAVLRDHLGYTVIPPESEGLPAPRPAAEKDSRLFWP